MSFGLKGAAISQGIAQGLNQAGSSLLNATIVKKQIDNSQQIMDKRLGAQDAMNRRLLAAKMGWARGLQGPGVGPVRPASSPAQAGAPDFEQSVGNFNLPAFAPSKDFGEMGAPGPRLSMPGGADLLARREEEY